MNNYKLNETKTMWTAQTKITAEGVLEATATHDSGFRWSETIKVGEESFNSFAANAKEHLAKYQEKHKDDEAYNTQLETKLNQ